MVHLVLELQLLMGYISYLVLYLYYDLVTTITYLVLYL